MEKEPGQEPTRRPRFGILLLVCVLVVAFCGWLAWFSVNHLPDWMGP